MKKQLAPLGLGLAGCLLALGACSTEAPEGGATGAGVTDDTIRLGILQDLSGPFANAGDIEVNSQRAYWEAVNKDGGICGRQVELDVRDHGYDPQRAVALYRGMRPEVLAFQVVFGTPASNAVMPLAEADGVYVGGMGFPSAMLDYRAAQLPGGTYITETSNMFDYMTEELGVKEGDTVGVIYFAGDYGNDSLAGAEFAAERHGLKLLAQEVKPTDQDMSAQVTALQRSGATAVVASAGPVQLASLAAVMAAQGFDIPILGSSPSYDDESVLRTSGGAELERNLHMFTQVAPYGADTPGAQRAAELYEAYNPNGQANWHVSLAMAEAELLSETLRGTCDDLTQEGVIDAMRELSGFDADGLFPAELDYTEVGQPPMRGSFVSRAKSDVPGGLEVIRIIEGSETAKAYVYE